MQPPAPATGVPTPAGGRPRPTPRPRPDGLPTPPATEGPDVVGNFTDRMQTILQSAEDEAAEIRAKARAAVRAEEERLATTRAATRAEEEAARAALSNLVRQRDEVLADLTRMRGQLEALLSGPTARINVPPQKRPTAESGAAARRDPGAGQPLPGAAAPVITEPDAALPGLRGSEPVAPPAGDTLEPAAPREVQATTAVPAAGGPPGPRKASDGPPGPVAADDAAAAGEPRGGV